MNITEAKNIPIQKLVEALGGKFSHTDRQGDHWYFSPFRPNESTASFKINEKRNAWHDFGMSNTIAHQKQGSGGDIIDLWCDFNFKDRRFAIKEALQALTEISPDALRGQLQWKPKPVLQKTEPRYKILNIADRITFYGLKDELHRRRISLKLANEYLKQGHILDTVTNKKLTGFLFENDKGGYEVSIPNPSKQECFKTCIGSKAVTRLLTSSDVTKGADVFEGFWDFLSWLEMNDRLLPKFNSYILNSVSLVKEVCEKMIAFEGTVKEVYLFMDNDEAGFQATHAIAGFLANHDFIVGSKEQLYESYKDLNDYWKAGLNVSTKK